MTTPPPSAKDQEHAVLILDQTDRLRNLGLPGRKRGKRKSIIARMLRNERLGPIDH